jgi:AraC-like DNA-binding protein
LLVTGGETIHTLDFVTYRLKRGSSLWVRPGQVQLFGDDQCAGDLVLFQPDFLIPGTLAATIANDRHRAAMAKGSTSTRPTRDRLRQALRSEYAGVARQGRPTPGQIETLRHLLSALILSLGSPIREQDGRGDQARVIARFRDLLERDFAIAHNVDHYARQLGYSTRTLERATQAVLGESPKQAINRRIILEARRLLAFTSRPVGTIARELGFRDPSNFSTFFTQESGETPTGFRRAAG